MGKKYDLTSPQKSIWYTEEVFKGTTVNNICTSGIIYEKINEDILKQAIINVVAQNDSFRIHLTLEDGIIKQYVSDFKKFDIDVEFINDASKLKEIEESESKHLFNLIDSDLFKFKIVILKNKFAAVILTANHIISDSWSMGITIQEILRNYHCLLNDEIPEQETFSYVDYIASEEKYLSSKKYESDKIYWNSVFETIPEQATIPSQSKNSVGNSYAANRLSFDINKKIVNKINAYCKEHHFSMFAFFMGIYSIYISRVSNTEDFVIGTPILNRTNMKEKHTTGMFVNTAPVRINMSNPGAFCDFTNSISQNMIGILRHQKYSYNKVLEDLRKENKNLANLYNIMISYQVTKAFNKDFGNYKTNWTFNGYLANDINIHITDINDTGNLSISYDYLVDKYSEKEISDLHMRIVYIIEQILSNSNILLDDIEIVTKSERDIILNKFNNTTKDYPKDKTIVDLFEEQVKKTPNNIAVVYENEKLSYKELNEKANSLANYLKSSGITKNTVVPVLMNRTPDLIISLLAIIKLGCVYLPISSETPIERVNFIIKDSNSQFLITDNSSISINKVHIFNINTIDYSSYNIADLKHKINPSDLLYIIYTSGSTGKPKGVKVCHQNLVNFIYSFVNMYKTISHEDRLLSSTSISFDVSIFELFMPLLNGFSLYLYNEQHITDVYNYCDYLINDKITFAYIPPNILEIVYNILSLHGKSFLNKLLIGVEPIKSSVIKKYYSLNPKIKIINAYGPTETTICATGILLNKKIIDNYSILPIGKPLNNLKLFILDKSLKPVPIGVAGELYISGDNVSKGYLNKPILTKKSFVEIPSFNCKLAYKTGDLAKWDNDGIINFIGRNDNQIKINGYRVELEEISSYVLNYPYIKKAIILKTNISGRDVLSCYFIADKEIDITDLKMHLMTFLPRYMIPTYFIAMDEFPYNANGKLDKQRLPEPKYIDKDKDIILPRNETDKKLISILKSLLNIKTISLDDNFFDLGGDSLSAINLSVKIQSEFNVQIFVKDILDSNSIEQISDIISQNVNSHKIHSIIPVSKSDFYPVSSAQKRIYFASQMAGTDSILYNIPGGVILDGEIDTDKLNNCFNVLIKRHESLRTYFELNNDIVVQKIIDNYNFNLDILDNCNYEDIDSLFKDFVKPFDLSKAPLIRAQVLKFKNGKSAIFIDMHHIISDGTSLSIFTDELCKLYNDEKLPELNITYKDYSNFENNRLKNDELKESENYWLQQYQSEIPVLNMPTNNIRPAVQSFIGSKINTFLNESTVKKISILCNNLGITQYMFLLACYYILLSKYTSQDDIIVGSPIVGRDISETYNLIGIFVNTLALRNKIDNNSSFRNFMLNLKEKLLNAYKHQSYPFDELVNKLNIKRDSSRNPLFDTMFIYQNNSYKEIYLNNIKAEYYIPNTYISKFDLSLEAIPNKDMITLNFEYSTSLFNESFIKDFSNHYLNIIDSVLNNSDIKISDICMLSKQENETILYKFNNTTKKYPKNKTIITLFEEQVRNTPDKVAVVFENQKLTYRALNEKANSLANYLINKGLKENNIVSLFLDKSIESIVAILATLKCGCAYMPIDVDYPQERIKYMLNNSNSYFILSTSNQKNKLTNYFNVIYIDLTFDEIYNYNAHTIKNSSTPESLAYIMYTSGSTGNPKGVMVSNKNVVRLVKNNSFITFENEERFLQTGSIVFDACTFEIWGSLLNGYELYIIKKEDLLDPSKLEYYLIKNSITILWITAPLFNQLCEHNPKIFSTVRVLLTGGDVLSPRHINMVKDSCPNLTIINGYGPTENTTFSTCFTIDKKYSSSIPIGYPISNSTCYVVSKDLQLLPINVPGELLVGGDGVSKGYLNNPSTTNSKFIPNMFGDGFLYRTGDMVKWNEDGSISFIGRIDNQVKIRGFRVELSEITLYIQKFDGIKDCVVCINEFNTEKSICAYFSADKKIDIPSLKDFLKKYLPYYSIPTYFMQLDVLPLNANGKIDRHSLPLPTNAINNIYRAPSTNLQSQLVEIFKKVLNIDNIGIDDNFFELGGDSLLAMNLNMEINKLTDKISYADIFRYPTVSDLERKINSDMDVPLFSKIDNLSDQFVDILNNTTNRDKVNNYSPKGILLTGATGFLGIHILAEYLDNSNANIFCIIREKSGINVKERLTKKLNYYFGNKYDHLIDSRIFVIKGDTSVKNFGLEDIELLKLSNSVDLVINSAAIVAHYGNYSNFYNANVKSVKNIVEFCNQFNKKLYHISTRSVAGDKLDTSYLLSKKRHVRKIKFTESSLYIGQILDGVYSRSKFEAENYILNNINKGLDAYILRMGNLMPRYKDYVFQENLSDNNYLNILASFIRLGFIPDYLKNFQLEFTPIDCAANAIIQLVSHPSKTNRIFHLYNHKTISAKKFIKVLKKLNYDIKILPDDSFKKEINLILENDNSKKLLNYLIDDFDSNLHLIYQSDILVKSKFTIKYLKKIHFKWPKITNKYLVNFINLLKDVI